MIGLPEILKPARDILAEEEVWDLIQKEERQDFGALLALMWLFGPRISEALKMKRKDIFVAGEYLRVNFHTLKRPDNKSANFDPLRELSFPIGTNRFIGVLIAYFSGISDEEQRLFSYSRSTSSWKLDKLTGKVWWHLFRKTRATMLARLGWSDSKLRYWFGWLDGRTPAVYILASPKLIEDVVGGLRV